VARLGGDEFVVLCPQLPDRDQAISLADRVRTALSAPYTIDGKEAFVDASIGITFADESTVSGAELMREADVAMYRAKLTEGSHINVFDSNLEAEVAQRLDLDAALRRALETRPAEAGRTTHRDAGLRRRHRLRDAAGVEPARDPGPQSRFVHPAGRGQRDDRRHRPLGSPGSHLRLAQWHAAGVAHELTISVNVSPRQVREPGFADEVLTLLRSKGVPAEALVIELTEHALIDLRVAHPVIDELRNAGVSISLDDFGTGYSSADPAP